MTTDLTTPTEAAASTMATPEPAVPAKPAKKEDSFPVFLIKLVLIVLVFRSFIMAPFNIPSESMLPRLLIGDYLLASKWSYGYSKHSLPFSVPLIPGRILASQPEPGDIAIFKKPPFADVDFIKRVIGLPGDQIQMIGGVLHLNGQAVPKVKVADYVIPVTQNMIDAAKQDNRSPCVALDFEQLGPDGKANCRYPQFRETLPNGVSYNVLDFGERPDADDTAVYVVPAGHVFMMGDNRDNSLDSRFSTDLGGVGFVPQENLVGKAQVMMFSTDGAAEWIKPWTWFSAARWGRIGGKI